MAGGLWRSWRAIFVSASVARAADPVPVALPDGPLDAQRYVVFDLETTGLRPSRDDAIVQIGAVLLEAGAEAGRFDMLVHPGRPIPPVSTRYHGITDPMVADAPRVADAVAAFRDFAAGAVLVAHNAAFDVTALRAAARRDGAPPLANPALCSMLLARWLDLSDMLQRSLAMRSITTPFAVEATRAIGGERRDHSRADRLGL
jgi:DNA polymerase-3 subunit epsilon